MQAMVYKLYYEYIWHMVSIDNQLISHFHITSPKVSFIYLQLLL